MTRGGFKPVVHFMFLPNKATENKRCEKPQKPLREKNLLVHMIKTVTVPQRDCRPGALSNAQHKIFVVHLRTIKSVLKDLKMLNFLVQYTIVIQHISFCFSMDSIGNMSPTL